jgi:hypothetical protein
MWGRQRIRLDMLEEMINSLFARVTWLSEEQDKINSYIHGRCLDTQPAPFSTEGTVTCLLMSGHDGKHSDGQAFWWQVGPETIDQIRKEAGK